jgi:outer membrane murein-binding lipoprotein Lpp
MEIYYSKKEYNEMKNRLSKQLKTANAKIAKLENKVKELKKDYETLLETATESSRNEE